MNDQHPSTAIVLSNRRAALAAQLLILAADLESLLTLRPPAEPQTLTAPTIRDIQFSPPAAAPETQLLKAGTDPRHLRRNGTSR